MRKLLQKIKKIISSIFSKQIDTSTDEGRHADRERRIALTAITGAFYKIISIAIPLITVRITLRYLGDETYGLWTTISSFFTLFTFADLGLGNGLQTELSRASAKNDSNDECKMLISSAFSVLFIVSTALMSVFLVLYPFVNWAGLMNAESEHAIAIAGSVVFAIVSSKIFEIPFALAQRTENALQEGYKSNLWQCLGSVLSLVLVIIIANYELGELTMIWASSFIIVVVSCLNFITFFLFQKKQFLPRVKNIKKSISFRLLKTGVAFLLLSILTSLSLSLDNFIVAHVVNVSEATPYSLLYKIAHLIGATTAMIAAPLWAANGEAIERGDVLWIKKKTRNLALISLALAVVASLLIIILVKPVMKWLKPDLSVNYITLIGMCLLQIAISVTNPYFMVLNAGRIIKFQIINYAIYSVISIGFKYFLGLEYGAIAVAWVGFLSYIVVLTPATYIKAKRYLNSLSKQITASN